MGSNRGSYPFSTLGRVAVAPLPPTPKITEVNCTLANEYVPFVDGWDQKDCPVEVGENNFYATIAVKGENLTADWLSKVVKGGYYNGGNEIEGTAGEISDYGDGKFGVDINFAFAYGEGDTVQFEIDGIKSAWMTTSKSN